MTGTKMAVHIVFEKCISIFVFKWPIYQLSTLYNEYIGCWLWSRFPYMSIPTKILSEKMLL